MFVWLVCACEDLESECLAWHVSVERGKCDKCLGLGELEAVGVFGEEIQLVLGPWPRFVSEQGFDFFEEVTSVVPPDFLDVGRLVFGEADGGDEDEDVEV